MKVLVVGGGGREHAIVWKLSQSRHIDKIYCCPGNAGIAEIAECIDVTPNDIDALIDFVKYEWIDLTIASAEEPLIEGIVNSFERGGCRIFGPNRAAAQLRASRVFAKDLMRLYGVPTSEYKVFASYLHAEDYVRLRGAPVAIKADRHAEGNDTFIASTVEEAIDTLRLILNDRVLGEAGRQVIIEEVLEGYEISFMVLTDGKTVIPLAVSKNYKGIFDGDKGPITGGAGAYSPAPRITKKFESVILGKIIGPVLKALNSEGIQYRGVLAADIVIEKDNPYVVELDCTFGDPEIQVILPRLRTDFMEIALATTDEKLSGLQNAIEWKQETSLCIVISSKGYPKTYQKGFPISGIDRANQLKDVTVFHAGTAYNNGDIVTSGGKVVSVIATGVDIQDVRAKAYRAAGQIYFEGMHYRKDIGREEI
ncbi:MAG: phosphoribosylamine--glycine ligase [Nitrospirae bacterium RBG_13_43_8]|nr:MAG: phosphoribosylamine--glycine ligase [Nitrospirae bacterium RBG_13_43_8]